MRDLPVLALFESVRLKNNSMEKCADLCAKGGDDVAALGIS
jgi:hypothetical protein